MFQQMGFGLGVAVLIDATLVRSRARPGRDGAARRPQLVAAARAARLRRRLEHRGACGRRLWPHDDACPSALRPRRSPRASRGGGHAGSPDGRRRGAAEVAVALPVGWSFVASGPASPWRAPPGEPGRARDGVRPGFAWFAHELMWSDATLLFTLGSCSSATYLLGLRLPAVVSFPDGPLQHGCGAGADARAALVIVHRRCSSRGCCSGYGDTPDSRRCPDNLVAGRRRAGGLPRRSCAVAAGGSARRSPCGRSSSWRAAGDGRAPRCRLRDRAGAVVTGAIAFALRRCRGCSTTPSASRSPTGRTSPCSSRSRRCRSRSSSGCCALRLARARGRRPRRGARRRDRAGGAARRRSRRALRDPSLTVAYWLPTIAASYVDADGLRGDASGRPRPRGHGGRARRAAASRRSSTTRRWRDRARARRLRRARRRRSRSRTSGCRPSCAPGSRSCAPRARASSRPPRPSAGGSSATSTTARSSGWCRSRWRSGSPSRGWTPTRPPSRPLLAPRRATALSDALGELRELSHGIHPGILTERGLGAALERARLRRAACRSSSTSTLPRAAPRARRGRRLLRRLRGADQRRQARRAPTRVRVGVRAGRTARAVVEVADDGVGGADARARHRPARARRPRRGARRPPARRQPAGRGHRACSAEIPCA